MAGKKPKRRSAKRDATEIIPTQTALAAALGVSRQTVAQYIKRADWPFGRAKFDLAQVLEWRRETLKRGPVAIDDDCTLAEANRRLRIAQASKLEHANEVERSKYVSREIRDRERDDLCEILNRTLEAVCAGVPMATAGMDPAEEEEYLRDRCEQHRAIVRAECLRQDALLAAKTKIRRRGPGRPRKSDGT